jgi:hypothetical protein
MIETRDTSKAVCCDWSNRILLLALAGILFLTLYPFAFVSHPKLPPNMSPFLLGNAGKSGGPQDVVLNILLFIPFGFALGAKLKRRKRAWQALAFSWLVGALVSYTIEFLQLYIPLRDSGWEDVVTNSIGSLVGGVLALLAATALFRALSNCGARLNAWATPIRVTAVLLIYFAGWFAFSVALQRHTQIDNWRTDCFLVVGNDAAGRHRWNGEVSLLEIWDHALPENVAGQLTRAEPAEVPLPLVRLDFSRAAPRTGDGELSVPFSVAPLGSAQAPADLSSSKGISSGLSTTPVRNVVDRLKRAGQFSLHIVFQPAESPESAGRILSISNPAGQSDIYLGQDDAKLVFWFRTPVSAPHPPALVWTTSNLLEPSSSADVIYSYDGSDLDLYMGGRKIETRPMGPSLPLASLVRHVKQGELDGYRDIYYALIFVPPGALLGIAVRKFAARPWQTAVVAVLGVFLAPVVLEWIFMRVDARTFSVVNFALSVCFGIGGMLWINSDGARCRPYRDSGMVES